ncbi:MAG: manganese efflux pump MntP family protein [Candidatus Omnitrophota bacterium]
MNFPELFILAFALAMDAFAVAVMSGFIIPRPRMTDALKIGLSFGIFQAFMPVLGGFAGSGLRALITNVDHWIAFGLLGLLGGKMIAEGLRPPGAGRLFDPLRADVLFALSLATSIDAFVAGIGFAFLEVPIGLAAVLIGAVTFFLSCIGVQIGKRFGQGLQQKVKILGGIILAGLGLKILLEHLAA